MKLKIKYTEEQIKSIEEKELAIKEAERELKNERNKIAEELGCAKNQIGFLYYSKAMKTGERDKNGFMKYKMQDFARVACLTHYEMFSNKAIARFHSVNNEGKTGNEITLLECENIQFEPFNGTVLEAKEILKQAKKK